MKRIRCFTITLRCLLLTIFTTFLLTSGLAATAEQQESSGRVYVMTNKAEGNSVQVYARFDSGTLQFSQEVPTRGLGTGFTLDPLQSQGSLVVSRDGKLVFAVNAASGEVTALRVTPTGLVFASKAKSGGALPVSVTEFGGFVYVLNQLGIANIAGFTVNETGQLTELAGSKRVLAGGALSQPAQVSFTPDGSQLLVTEKGTDLIDIFQVQPDGLTRGPTTQMSSGKTPFGFAFGPGDSVVVTEAQRRLPMKSSSSSYLLTGSTLTPVSRAIPNQQTGACWVAITGETAWVVNTGTSTISAYSIGPDGQLTLRNADAAFTGAGTSPIDVAATPDGTFIYVLESAVGTLAGYRVNANSLSLVFQKTGLPLSIQGIAVQ
jgi:6-phosphogluconolactonase